MRLQGLPACKHLPPCSFEGGIGPCNDLQGLPVKRPQYWDWPRYQDAPQDSPIFNGDPYSMGGNGVLIPGHEGPILNPPPGTNAIPVQFPPGVGGGYVVTGPLCQHDGQLGPRVPPP